MKAPTWLEKESDGLPDWIFADCLAIDWPGPLERSKKRGMSDRKRERKTEQEEERGRRKRRRNIRKKMKMKKKGKEKEKEERISHTHTSFV